MSKNNKKKKMQNASAKNKNIKKKSAAHKKNGGKQNYYPNGNRPGNKKPNSKNPRKNSYSKKNTAPIDTVEVLKLQTLEPESIQTPETAEPNAGSIDNQAELRIESPFDNQIADPLNFSAESTKSVSDKKTRKKKIKKTKRVYKKRWWILAAFLLCVLAAASVFGVWYFENSSIYKVCRVEAGIEVSVNDFLKSSDENAVFTAESDKIDITIPGEYHLVIKKKFFEHPCTLYIEDTIAPTFDIQPLVIEYGQTCTPEDFVKNVKDATKTTVTFVGEPDFSSSSVQNVRIVVADAANNIAMKETQLTISMVLKTLEVEAGGEIPKASDFIISDAEATIHTDMESIDYTQLATHVVIVELDGEKYEVDMQIVDTTAPVFTVEDYSGYTKCKPDAEKFVKSSDDVTELTYSFETEPDFTKTGTQDVVIIATDKGGNTTSHKAKMTLEEDTEAPVIEFVKETKLYIGDSASYKSYVKVTDNCKDEPALTIDAAGVDINKTGIYTVTYTATDCSGNSSSKSMELVVCERTYSLDEVNAIADNILARIITPGMSTLEKTRAIFDYVKGHIGYISFSEKGDYVRAAYEGFTTGRGDCYVYASASKVLLTRAGITNMDIERIPSGNSMHYWNLVDIGDGHGWYHFDTTPRKDRPVIFLWDDATIKKYSDAHNNCHNYDRSRYPVIN